VLARAATDPAVRESLAVLRAQGTNSLLQSALVIARAANVSNIFLIRAVTLRTDPMPLVREISMHRARGFQATVDAVLVRASDGEVLWAGEATGRSTDILRDRVWVSGGVQRLERSDLASSPALQDTVCDDPCAQRPRGVVTLVQIAVRRLGVELARRGTESGSAPAAAADAGACQGGRRITADTAGNCCWEGQVWSNLRARCVGVPTCPAGARVQGEDCAL
jgi:hypothetical protein